MTPEFRRPIPPGDAYSERLSRELSLIERGGFMSSFVQVREILDLAGGIRHITRGSAGCSLVAYLMGIHDMDPVEGGFALARFMHERRPDLPDIDIDFAHNHRDGVVEKVMRRYPGRVARISNHVSYREGSAIRQALREAGFRGFIPRRFDLQEIAGSRAPAILERSRALQGSFRNFSLHCGGIVIFPGCVPEELKISESQVSLNKDDVERMGLFKIDLLCNRGISQLNDLSSRGLCDYPEEDEAAAKLFRTGDTWGVTFAESPAQRKLHRELLPSSRSDVTLSLALIRPLPSADNRRREILESFRRGGDHGHVVYDDDGIEMIRRAIGCTDSEAEMYRKAFAKGRQEAVDEFTDRLGDHPDRRNILRQLGYFRLYSFCRAHAASYGCLVWALAYEKARQPKRFWWSALNHAQSMYRPWVHVQQAKAAGLRFRGFGRGGWGLDGDDLVPAIPEAPGDGWAQYASRGYWTSNRFMPGMYCRSRGGECWFRGLIATARHHTVEGRRITFVTVGHETGQFLDLVLDGLHDYEAGDVVEGHGRFRGHAIQCDRFDIQKSRPERTLFDGVIST